MGHDFIFISGPFGSTVLNKVRGEIKTRNLDHLKKCRTGLEVHFKEDQGCYATGDKTQVPRRTKRRSMCSWCIGCSWTRVLVGN